MSAKHAQPGIEDDDAEAALIKALIADSHADRRSVSHDQVQERLLSLAKGAFDTASPVYSCDRER